MSEQGPSEYWGTGRDLGQYRQGMDDKKATALFKALAARIHGKQFTYDLTVFRSMYHDVTFKRGTKTYTVPAIQHLLSVDGISVTLPPELEPPRPNR